MASPAFLTNATSAAAMATNDIRDIRPPVPTPDYWPWFWVAATLCVLAAAAYFFLRRRSKGVPPPAIPVIPPHTRARQRLQNALALLPDPDAFCTEVSAALRTYLEERFDFHAPDRTTEEFLAELKATPLLLPGQKLSVADFLSRCDLAKFARHEPTESELRQLHDAALRLIDETQYEPLSSPAETTARP